MKIAISGAGIAGTTLAYWLGRAGHHPVLIERSPEFRGGGYIIDFWGLGYEVARRMGIEPTLLRLGYQPEEVRFVNERGEKSGGFTTDTIRKVAGDFVSIQRSALAGAIYEALGERVEPRFDESISALEERDDGVTATLARGGAEDFDLVIGADGLHSAVRTLRFGEEERFETYMGYAVAAFEVQGYRPREEGAYVIYPRPSH